MNLARNKDYLVPKGRDESSEPMSWLRRRDEYDR
jgi:predicted dithiol-disulfide oxidoreductase (DUF899 family)